LPISVFIPKEKIPDPHDVRLELKVNGVTKQDDKTDLMIFKIPELMEAVTDVMPLLEGDMLLSIDSLSMITDD
jgi:acylpyruvate hydrolase